MRAVQVHTLTGPDDIQVTELPEPTAGPGQVLVEVHSVGVSFPDLLLSRGQYQLKPEPPFTLGVDYAGVVAGLGEGVEGLEVGQRVVGFGSHGGAAELAVAPVEMVFPLPDELSYDEGSALPMNYLTALFALEERGGLREGETVLIHGAAGGVGTATIQVAKALGARTIAVCSTEEKAAFAKSAGADEAILIDGFKDAVKELTGGRGVDVVLDVVGGDVFTDSLRSLAPQGRLLVVGFAAGQGIPEVKVNRLLLNNIDVRGVGWGAFVFGRPDYLEAQWERLVPMITSGVVKPPIGQVYPMEQFAQALHDMDNRAALGKLVVTIRG
ncbi:NADPH:quinone oxidoreductase family protein [Nocardioides sp. YIM 152588]|uniref:NADPH:quinone oxidoreductase family protein n=1 Tax=Nocardioides sp. YIM 152588 TaxID=3158259 RepID=UPI0032E41444